MERIGARWVDTPAALLFAGTLVSGLVHGFVRWRDGMPEWSFYQRLVLEPLSQATGPDEPLFGYLPGCKVLLAPFVLTQPAGYFLFAALNVLACMGIYRLVLGHFSGPGPHPLPGWLPRLWLSICAAVPCWFVLQNNQLVAASVVLTLCAFSLMTRRREALGGAVFAIAVLLKTLPLPLLLFALLRRRWRFAVSATLTVLGLSVGLTCLAEGVWEGLRSHARWPSQVAAQDPAKALVDGGEPRSFRLNHSPAAEMVRLARRSGTRFLPLMHTVFVLVSLLVLAASSLRCPDDHRFWLLTAGWMAWVAYATPFGRYYYLLFLLPALYLLGLKALARLRDRPWICGAVLAALSVLFLKYLPKARFDNSLYAKVCFGALVLFLIVLVRDKPKPQAGAVDHRP